MNWHFIFIKLLPIVVGFVVILLSYYLPASFIKDERKSKTKAATTWEKTWAFARTIAICSVLSGIAANGPKEQLSYFFILEFLSTIPAFWGLWGYFEKDAKLTLEDRIKLRQEMENREANTFYDGRY